ncbi:MAG: phosphoribosyl-AMP cyclohydrolase [Candidatus Aureabacteria bacterium]|nr:phosphoribosyl-AMP cyclohydrolase [Candidatus Auribacterota bacterium]
MNFIETIKLDSAGLVPAIVQDAVTREVIMVAYMNKESLEKTIKDGIACYYSRSRKKLWVKGETSGNVQKVKELRFDCDRDAILLIVEQKGGACHTGYFSCFYTRYSEGQEEVIGKKVFDPEEVYKDKA